MAENDFNLLPLLDYINPATVDYQTWVNVGMALKHEGYTASDWDNWSQNDSRYKKFVLKNGTHLTKKQERL